MKNNVMNHRIGLGGFRFGLAAIFAVLLVSLLAPHAFAVGFRLPNQDPEAIARGNAFTATADNPSAIYYNPAGITQLTQPEISYGLYEISAHDEFESATPGEHGSTRNNFQSVPQFYSVYPLKDYPITFGLGVYVPYGLSLDWGVNNPFTGVAENGSLLYATVNPVIAWQIVSNLSIAIGPTLNYAKADFNRGPAPGQFHFVGDGFDAGFNAGLFWHPIPMFAFGLNYRYLDTMDFKGHASSYPPDNAFPASGTLRFPQYAVAGFSFRPTTNWNFEFDLDWTDWDNVNTIGFKAPLPQQPLNYRSSFMYEFGATRQLPHGYFVSAGYFYSENSSPDQDFTPQIPDSALHLFSVGFGHKGVHWDWAASYTAAFNFGRTLTAADGNIYGTPIEGTYRTMNNAINVSVGYKF